MKSNYIAVSLHTGIDASGLTSVRPSYRVEFARDAALPQQAPFGQSRIASSMPYATAQVAPAACIASIVSRWIRLGGRRRPLARARRYGRL